MTRLAASTDTAFLTPSRYRGSTKSFLFGSVQEAGGGRRGHPGKERLQEQLHQLLSTAVHPAGLRVSQPQTSWVRMGYQGPAETPVTPLVGAGTATTTTQDTLSSCL